MLQTLIRDELRLLTFRRPSWSIAPFQRKVPGKNDHLSV